MKLTKFDREAFVRAVMDDVPQIDYDERVRAKMKAWGLASLPKELQPMAVKYPDYFNPFHISMPVGLSGVVVICNPDWKWSGFQYQEPAKYAELVALAAEATRQSAARVALRVKLEATIAGCSTLKVAKAALPEFEKYLPADRDGPTNRSMPAVANLVVDLTSAGWPKSKAR